MMIENDILRKFQVDIENDWQKLEKIIPQKPKYLQINENKMVTFNNNININNQNQNDDEDCKSLGNGGSGSVFKIKNNFNNFSAVKFINIDEINQLKSSSRIIREILLLR